MIPIYLFLTLLLWPNFIVCLEREMTINVEPGRENCFYQSARPGDVIDFEYQVIDGGHGDLDITFHLADPKNRILVTDYKKSENTHRADADLAGDYKFCFDNTFSSYNTKTIFFELIIEGENDDSEWSNEQVQGLRGDEGYEVKVQDVLEVMNRVRNQLNNVRHVQELLKSTEARDRNTAEANFFKVNTFSMVQIFVMLLVGFIQVVMVRSLFDDKSKAHRLWNVGKR